MTSYKYLFGPVPSRRLDISLGVDLVPHKICSLNCAYCECGSTTKFKIQTVIDGLVELRKEFTGKLWLEIFIVPGLNDTDEEISLLRKAIHCIRPDEVQLNTLDRPGTADWVQSASRGMLTKVADKLDWRTEIIANFQKREQLASYSVDIESALLQTIKRRPCTVGDLSSALGLHPNEINKYIETLLERKQIRSVVMERGVFFRTINNGKNKIVTYPHKVLLTKAKPVEEIDKEIQNILDTMVKIMIDYNGIGLAAPQIGVLLRLITVRDKNRIYKLINPKIAKKSRSLSNI